LRGEDSELFIVEQLKQRNVLQLFGCAVHGKSLFQF
jgi:hypothetical protein